MIYNPERMYWSMRQTLSNTEIESTCRQVLAICDAEYIKERARLQEEQRNLLRKRQEQEMEESGYVEAEGIIL